MRGNVLTELLKLEAWPSEPETGGQARVLKLAVTQTP
jgi:hypothetical protein